MLKDYCIDARFIESLDSAVSDQRECPGSRGQAAG